MKNYIFLGLAGVLLCLSACETTGPGRVQRDWSYAIRELQIVPVFPPRSDFYVGDVYMPGDRDKKLNTKFLDKYGFEPIGTWVSRSEKAMAGMDNVYKKLTPAYPPTGEAESTYVGDGKPAINKIAPIPAYKDKSAYTTTDNFRLQQVGFPEFLSATTTDVSLSAVIPIEAISLALGADYSSSASVKVSIPLAESAGLPLSELLDLDLINEPKLLKAVGFLAKSDPSIVKLRGKEKYVEMTMISEVFYARTIDVSITSSKAFAGSVAASLTGVPAKGSGQAALKAAGSAASGSSPRDPEEVVQGLINKANANLEANNSNLTPGGKAKILSANANSVGVRRTYQQPVAIGYRGVTVVFLIDDKGVAKGVEAKQATGGQAASVLSNPSVSEKK